MNPVPGPKPKPCLGTVAVACGLWPVAWEQSRLSLWPWAVGAVYHGLSEAPAVALTAGPLVLADFLLPSHARPL